MRSQYSETLWEKIVSGQKQWSSKGPFCGKNKGFRLLRVSTGPVRSLACFENMMAL